MKSLDFVKIFLTAPFVEPLSGSVLFLVGLLWWALAVGIMIYFGGDWRDFLTYFIWAIAIGIGFAFLIIPGLIILAIFLWRYGLINIIAILLGPVGWAIGSVQGWLE